MTEKNIKSRIIHKHDSETNWLKATNFIPMQGELIVYDRDTNYDYERFKIGDGVTLVNDLPFADEPIVDIIDTKIEALKTDTTNMDAVILAEAQAYTDAAIAELGDSNTSQPDWNQNNETAVDYIKNRTHYSETTEEEYPYIAPYILTDLTPNDDGYYEFAASVDSYDVPSWVWSPNQCKIVLGDRVFYGAASFDDYIGNKHISDSTAEDTGEDYLFVNCGDYFYIYLSPSAVELGTTSLAIYAINMSENVHQLDDKYIPASIARKSSVDTLKTEVDTVKTNVSKCVKSVNGKTPNSNGAVNITYAYDDLTDKPFGIIQEEGYAPLGVLDGRSFEFATQENVYYVQEIDPTGIYFADGHYITWDGTFYECGEPVYIEADNSYLLGGVDMGEISITNNMPFCIKVTNDAETYEPTSAKIYTRWAGPHTIKVTTWYSDMIDVVKPLDEQFIPDTIARTKDVISLPPYTSADEGKILKIVNGKPTWVSLPNAEEATF